MPFVLAPELAAVGAAVLLALLCMAVVYLIKAIAAALPNFHIAFIHIDFGAIFRSIASPVASWLTGVATGLFSTVEGWLRAIPYLLSGLFHDVIGALDTVFSQVDHVVTVIVPNAAAGALGDAKSLAEAGIRDLEHEIAAARTAIGTTIPRDIAHEWLQAERLVKTTKNAILASVGAAVITAEGYADRGFADAKGFAEGLVDALPKIPAELVAGVDYATPAALAAVGAAVAAITAEFESCAVTNCAGKNNLSSLLSDLLGLGGLAAFGEFLAQVIKNPAAAEAQYAGVFSGLIGGAESVLDTLLSL